MILIGIVFFLDRTYVLMGWVMKSDNYHILELMLEEFQNEYDRISSEMNNNSNRMKEADYFENSILENEDLNFKFFSPRDAESVHKDEIVKARKDKIYCQKQRSKGKENL